MDRSERNFVHSERFHQRMSGWTWCTWTKDPIMYWKTKNGSTSTRATSQTVPATVPDLVLRSFEPPAVQIRGRDLTALLTPAYQRMAGEDARE